MSYNPPSYSPNSMKAVERCELAISGPGTYTTPELFGEILRLAVEFVAGTDPADITVADDYGINLITISGVGDPTDYVPVMDVGNGEIPIAVAGPLTVVVSSIGAGTTMKISFYMSNR